MCLHNFVFVVFECTINPSLLFAAFNRSSTSCVSSSSIQAICRTFLLGNLILGMVLYILIFFSVCKTLISVRLIGSAPLFVTWIYIFWSCFSSLQAILIGEVCWMNFVSLGINPHWYSFQSTSSLSSVSFQSNVNECQRNNISACP